MAPGTLRVPHRLTVEEAADRLGTTTRWVYYLIRSGALNAERSGRRVLFVHDDTAFRRLERARRCA